MNLALVQCKCHTGKYTVTERNHLIEIKLLPSGLLENLGS